MFQSLSLSDWLVSELILQCHSFLMHLVSFIINRTDVVFVVMVAGTGLTIL